MPTTYPDRRQDEGKPRPYYARLRRPIRRIVGVPLAGTLELKPTLSVISQQGRQGKEIARLER